MSWSRTSSWCLWRRLELARVDEVEDDDEWCASADAVGLALDERRGDIVAELDERGGAESFSSG